MTSLYGYDDAYRPTLDQLAAGNPTAVAVYLTGTYAVPSTWPGQIRARGWAPVANYEEAAGQLVDCWESGGVTIGQTALAAALRDQAIFGTCTCGRDGSKPCRSAIYYSIDENVPESAFGAVGLAFDGINQSHGSKACAHAYCEGALGEYLLSTKRICSYWLSSSSSYPGYNPQAAGCSMYQIYGSSPVPGTDQNIITHPASLHGFWPDN